jgi:hypothetical protein
MRAYLWVRVSQETAYGEYLLLTQNEYERHDIEVQFSDDSLFHDRIDGVVLVVCEMASFMVESGGGEVFLFILSWMDVDREVCGSRLLFPEERHVEPLLGDNRMKLHR